MTSAVMNADEASVTLTVTHTDSEGTTGQTQTITIRASRIKQGESGVVVNLNPPSQVVTRSNTGTYGAPTTFVVSVVEGATTYTYDGTSPYAVSTFRISDLVGGTNSSGTITPTTPTTTAGTLVSFNVIYVNAAGTSVTIPQTHKVSVTLDGQTGPGVVFTGNWETGRAYQFSAGAGTGRRDVVLYPASSAGTYYAATVQHTSTPTGVTGPPTVGTYWESLGAQDFFVAAKIGLFEDSYVQSTLNIGNNNNGGVSTANITLAGGTSYPYFSLGQTTAAISGSTNTEYKMSLKSASNSLLWDGTSLTINGAGTFSGALSGGTISIGSGNSIFRATTDGIWLGNAVFADAPFSVSAAGALKATSANITGVINATSGNFSGPITSTATITGGTIIGGTISGGSITGGIIAGGSIVGSNLAGGTIHVPNATNPLFEVNSAGIMTATDAVISGRITATSGLLGSWVVDPPAAGGSLKDNTGRIVLNPTDKRISMFNSSGELKAQINADDTLSQIGAGNIYVSGIGNETSAPSGPTSDAGSLTAVVGTPTYSTAATFTIPTAGEYQLSELFSTYSPPPTINLASKVSSLGTVSVSTGNPYGYITPFYPGDYYSSTSYGRSISQNLFFVIENDSTGAEIAALTVSTANARGGYSITNQYYANSISNTAWQYLPGYSSAGNSWSSTTTPPITAVVNFPSAGTYRVRYKSVMSAQSGYQYYLDGTTENGAYTYFTVSGIGGVALSSLYGAVNFNKPANFIEMSGGGFQAVTNSNQFVKITREAAGTTNYGVTLLQVEGGRTVLNQDDATDEVLYVNGKSTFVGRTDLGSSFYGSNYYDPIGVPKLANMAGMVQNTWTIASPGTSANPENLAYAISQGNMQIWLNYSSATSRYFALPNELSTNVYEPLGTSVTNLQVGTTLFLFNRDNSQTVYIRGILPGSGNDTYQPIGGGGAVILVYSANNYLNNPTQYYKWIVYSSYDNNW
jgi:hypothetical protein